MVVAEGRDILDVLCKRSIYSNRTVIYSNSRITYMQYSQKNFMRIIGNDQKNNGQNFWEILVKIIGKISSIIGASLVLLKCNLIPCS